MKVGHDGLPGFPSGFDVKWWCYAMWRILFLLGLGAAMAAGPARADQMFDGSEIRSLLLGKSALFADYSVSEYLPDGRYSYVAANNLLFRGRYAIEGNKLCLALDDEPRFCQRVGIDSLGLFMLTDAGIRFRFSIAAGVMPRETATLCGVPVAYNLVTPAVDVPEKARAFAGVWTGQWKDGLCSALIVESVQANGHASLIYVHGSRSGAQPLKAGTLRLAGTIAGNRLTNGVPESYMEYVLRNNELSGSYSLSGSSSRGSFRRP